MLNERRLIMIKKKRGDFMKKIFILLVVLCVLFSVTFLGIAQDNNQNLIQRLKEIRKIENDIQRLEEYDKLVDSIKEENSKEDTTKSNEELIVEHSGKGVKTTRPFTTNGPWEIQWDAEGQIFQIYLYSGEGNLVDVAANQTGAGTGSYYNPKDGTYYIEVNAMGNWELKIINVK